MLGQSAGNVFGTATRLYALRLGNSDAGIGVPGGELLVEAFLADDAIQGLGMRDVIALSTSAATDPLSLLGQPATLEISLADGARASFGGEICEAAQLGSNGGLARYRVRIAPWIWRLAHVRNSRVWQDRSVTAIIDDVFSSYSPTSRWRWSSEVCPFMEGTTARSYCCQYRESDLAFVERLLAEEGLSWRFEQDDGPLMVLFADSRDAAALADDPSSLLGGARFHGAHAREQSDAVHALATLRSVSASAVTLLSYDYKKKRAIAATSPSRLAGGSLPPLESFDTPGQYAYADGAQARRYADLQMESREARSQLWRGRSTLRTLRAGTRLTVTGAPLSQLGEAAAFTVLRVTSVGVNNLPTRRRTRWPNCSAPSRNCWKNPCATTCQTTLRSPSRRRARAATATASRRWPATSSGARNCPAATAAAIRARRRPALRPPSSSARTATTRRPAPTSYIATALGGCGSATTGRTVATPRAGCAWPSVWRAAASAASSCRASARKSSSSSSRTISIARSSSARCTTARARAA